MSAAPICSRPMSRRRSLAGQLVGFDPGSEWGNVAGGRPVALEVTWGVVDGDEGARLRRWLSARA